MKLLESDYYRKVARRLGKFSTWGAHSGFALELSSLHAKVLKISERVTKIHYHKVIVFETQLEKVVLRMHYYLKPPVVAPVVPGCFRPT